MSHAYDALTHERVMDAVESTGLIPDGRVLALNSYENRVFQIGIDEHPGVVGKFYRPGRWSNAAILEEHAFSLALAEEHLPVVAPLEFAGVSLLNHSGFRFALFPRRGGRSPDLENLDNLEWIGRFIGRLHRMGSSSSFQYRLQLDSQTFGWQARQELGNSSLLPSHHRQTYLALSEQVLEAVEQAFAKVKPEYRRIHGDCHPGNILWTAQGPHFVDLDDACNGPAVQDFWMLLSGERQEMQWQLDALLEGYRSFHDFNTAELALIEPLRSLRLLHYTAWVARRWEDPAFPLAFPWMLEESYWSGYLADLEQQLGRMAAPPLQVFFGM